MSKINAVRLINLNYNNNSIRVSDETFQLGGQSTLLSLRNGGGKSVLVQMMTAPFVHKQYRKTKDRPFESYFTTSKPTFIMVEWALDQGAGYCLTGMMVRRSQTSEEQSSEPLEIINFISEYPARCEQDIYNIPVVEKSSKEIVLKNFNACRQLFETYKKDHSKKFFYYDMNNYAQSRQYFDKLSEYQIHYKEWEKIIRKVNEKESGLSELFSDCKNEKELIEKWFLTSIESKLEREQNRMKEFQTIIEKYIRMYKDNKSKIERRDTILKFKEDMIEVEEKADLYRQAEKNVLGLENRIACFVQELRRIETCAKELLSNLEEQSQDCRREIAHILYEKLSMELHELSGELKIRCGNLEMIQDEMDALEEEIQNVERILHIYTCAKQQNAVDEQWKEYEFLTQKIEVSRISEQELEPERRQLGACLKKHYRMRLEETKLAQEKKETEYKETEKLKQQEELKEENCQKQIEELIGKIAECRTRMENFPQKEENFNRSYNESFSRNILGDYAPGMLDIKKEQYEKQLKDLTRSYNQHIRQQGELAEQKKNCERNREDRQNEKKHKELQLHILQEKGKDFDEQIKERQTIMRYLQVEDSVLWNTDKLLEVAERKLSEIDRSRQTLEQEKNAIKLEWKKLTSGEVLELPQEFKELLTELELHPVYGMNWLDKNGYSVDENTELIRKQPFLPYSLILARKEMRKLESHGKEIYTSFPIPIIPREALEEVLLEEESSMLNLQGISFFMWFNEKLLDEEALRVLITQKEEDMNKVQKQIEFRAKEYEEYAERRSILKNQTLSKEGFEKNRKEQEEVQEHIDQLDKEIYGIQEEVQKLIHTMEMFEKSVATEKQEMEQCRRREVDYEQFCASYQEYLKNRKDIEHCKQEKQRYEENKRLAISSQEKYNEMLRKLERDRHSFTVCENQLKEKQMRFEGYGEPDAGKPNLTPEEIETRYEAITTQMSSRLQELEERQERTGKLLVKERNELDKLRRKYHLSESDWKMVIYNEQEEQRQEILLEDKQKKWKMKESFRIEEDKEIAVFKSKIEDKKKGIYEQCGYEEPLSKEDIHTADFDAKMNRLKYRLSELEKESKLADKRKQSIEANLTAFAEYQDFMIIEPVVWQEDFAQMDAEMLRKFGGGMRRDYREATEECKKRKDRLEAQLNKLLQKDIYHEDYYRKPLEAMVSVVEHAEFVLKQLHTTIQSYDSQMEKLEVDIALVEKEKSKIEGLLEDYVKDIHSNMAMIDNNSTITIRERQIKMLRLQIPDWEENEGLYRQRMEDFMDELTRTGIEIYERNENAADYFSSRITTKNLYDTIVGIGNIQIKLYKIEEQREYPITWAEVARNSGGEGFLSAFVILSSLLHYMRRDETDIFADKNEGKVLVMDNPFAQTNASHLLKPLMDMAKKTNTQLICLSGLGGDSIYSRFDNIYVLNLVAASLRGGMQYLRGEHTRGVDEDVMVSSQIEVYEQQSLLF
ncbi:MAG: hypothetical protein IJD40_02025 [Lachnospiraceae bacterium]|nr:hypothetical protein [Lachnospiraceae bacterium]